MRAYLLSDDGTFDELPHPSIKADPQAGVFPDSSLKVRGAFVLYGLDPDGNWIPAKTNADGELLPAS